MNQGLEADRTTATPGPGFQFGEEKMRIAAGLIFAGAVSLLASSAAWSQALPGALRQRVLARPPGAQPRPWPAAFATMPRSRSTTKPRLQRSTLPQYASCFP